MDRSDCTILLHICTQGVLFQLSLWWPENAVTDATPNPTFQRNAFSNPGRAILKVMAMTTGELDYDELYHQQEGEEEIAFPEVSFLLWVTFLILMPILLSNLLVNCQIFFATIQFLAWHCSIEDLAWHCCIAQLYNMKALLLQLNSIKACLTNHNYVIGYYTGLILVCIMTPSFELVTAFLLQRTVQCSFFAGRQVFYNFSSGFCQLSPYAC